MATFPQILAEVWTPHPGQREFLEHPSRIKVLACGRRWGKTDACAAAVVAQMLGDTPTRTLILAPTLDQARMLFDRVVALLDAALLKRRAQVDLRPAGSRGKQQEAGRTKVASSRPARTRPTAKAQATTPKPRTRKPAKPTPDKPVVRKSPYPHLRFGDHVVMARSGHLGRALRGNEATHIVVDEAGFVPEELITEVAMPMLATTEGSLILIGTPNGLNHFWRFFRMGETGEHGVWSRTGASSESPFVSPGYLAIQRELISERAFRVEYEAEFVDRAGCLFRTDSIERCLVPELPSEMVRPPFCIGIDWGRYRDYSALVVLAGSREGAVVVETRRWSGLGWAEQCRQIADCLDRFPQCRVLCDATGLGDPAIERLREEAPRHAIRGLVMTAGAKAEIVEGSPGCSKQARFASPRTPICSANCSTSRPGPCPGVTWRWRLGEASMTILWWRWLWRAASCRVRCPRACGSARGARFHDSKGVQHASPFLALQASTTPRAGRDRPSPDRVGADRPRDSGCSPGTAAIRDV